MPFHPNATIASLTGGTTYAITVRATTAGGGSGDVSTPVSLTPITPTERPHRDRDRR